MSLSPLLLIIGAFIVGILSYLLFSSKQEKTPFEKSRLIAYQLVTGYLLFKIGFIGGSQISEQSFASIAFPALVCISLAFFWTFFVLFVLKKWSRFDEITQISLFAHLGSVSVGTFIAAIAFLESIGVLFDQSAALWLALMELPALIIAVWKLPISGQKIFHFLRKDVSLIILLSSLFLGVFFSDSIALPLKTFLFSTLFLPLLLYFIFEIGQKAGASIQSAKKNISSFLFLGIFIPILGGLFGASVGYFLGYSLGNSFLLSILLASASYVLAPVCMQEMLKSIDDISEEKIREIIGISMSLSVGIILPFNILIGLELYYRFAQATSSFPILAFIGISLPIVIIFLSLFKKYFFSPR